MFIVETLALNDGNPIPADGGTFTHEEQISPRWCKIVYVKIVQITAGPMSIDFDIVEDGSIFDPADRTTFYLRRYRRTINQDPAEGGEYGEALLPPVPYKDREADGITMRRFLHCRLTNRIGGTPSDFAVSFVLADHGEVV